MSNIQKKYSGQQIPDEAIPWVGSLSVAHSHICRPVTYKMNTNSEYFELLQNGKWLRKRDRILKRDNYTCQDCGKTSSLHVHHIFYKKNTLPWNYPDRWLITLCSECHEVWHDLKDGAHGQICAMLQKNNNNLWSVYGVLVLLAEHDELFKMIHEEYLKRFESWPKE